jgi:hypothetical protein
MGIATMKRYSLFSKKQNIRKSFVDPHKVSIDPVKPINTPKPAPKDKKHKPKKN